MYKYAANKEKLSEDEAQQKRENGQRILCPP